MTAAVLLAYIACGVVVLLAAGVSALVLVKDWRARRRAARASAFTPVGAVAHRFVAAKRMHAKP